MRAFMIRLSRVQIRTVVTFVILALLLLGGSLFCLWRWIGGQIEQVIITQFNQQQLMLARKIADNVEFYIDFLEYNLLNFRTSFRIESGFPEHFQELLAAEADYLKYYGVVAVRHFDAGGRLLKSFPELVSTPLPASRLTWAQNPQNCNQTLLTPVASVDGAQGYQIRRMAILTPLYGPDPNAPENNIFHGVVELTINPYYICKLVTQDVRSGQTGYAWIVDQDGFFMAHYEPQFIGQHHIAVRQERAPSMPFSAIDQIVSNELLQGREGISQYTSGWHRERVGEIKKLIAYTPIDFTRGWVRGRLQVEDPSHNRWGVGVVAPIDEVYGLVGRLQLAQGGVTIFFLLILAGVGLLLIGAAYSWNRILSLEVESKTEALRQSHERLLRSERFAAVGEAAAYVSHEIKNPLMIIGGFAKQLLRQPNLPPTAGEKLQIIVDEVKRLENFLGELRDFTRPALPKKQEVDLNNLIREVVGMMQDNAAANNITFDLQLDESLPLVAIDPNQMKQVLINLIKNALEAIEADGKITLTTRLMKDQIHLAVTDTGKGIPPEVMAEIFNPFFTTKKSGTGLGLPVVNKIVEDHHGTITVESTPQRGTTFTVILPCLS